MTSRSTRHLTPVLATFLLLALAAHIAGCGSRQDHTGAVGDRTSRASSAELSQELASYCAIPENLVPDSLTTVPGCKSYLGEQEMLLCKAYGHFNTATCLEMQAGVTWRLRLAHFRAAVENLLDLLFETGDLERVTGWQRKYTEDKLAENCPVNGDNPDNVDELLYYRQLKVQAVELYQRIAEYYTYAHVADADASRAQAGDTAGYSDAVWGTDPTDPELRFTGLTGSRGAALAFLIGTDVKVLDDLVLREDGPSYFTSIDKACGYGPFSEHYLFEANECNEHMVTPLPPCRYATRSAPLWSAVQALRRWGIPLDAGDERITDGDDLAEFLLARENQQRDQDGLEPYADANALLAQYGTDRAALENGVSYLGEEEGLYLFNLGEVEDPGLPADSQRYVIGHGGSRARIQGVEVRARVNGSRVVLDKVWTDTVSKSSRG